VGEVAFSDSFADLEISDTDRNPRAPKNGAEQTKVIKKHPDPAPTRRERAPQSILPENVLASQAALRVEVFIEELVSRLRQDLEPSLRSAALRAAAQEHERTREWLENKGLPKAARVAQHEAYSVLRKYGVIGEPSCSPRSQSEVGRNSYVAPESHSLSAEEVTEFAQACVAMYEAQGQSIDVTLSEMSSEGGGFLLPEDAGRVRVKASSLLCGDDGRRGK
jgi:hypothetical protein